MEQKKKKKRRKVAVDLTDLRIGAEPASVGEILRHYRQTGGFRRRDLRRVLGNETKGVSAGEKGLEEVIAGE